MSTKDLNLSLEYDLADTGYRVDGARGRGSRDASGAGRHLREGQKAAAARPKTAAVMARKHAGPSAWFAAGIALANMLFLLLAGIWLTGYGRMPATPPAASVAPIAEPVLTDLRTQLDAVQQQLAGLQTVVEAQHRLLVVTQRKLADAAPAPAAESDAGQAAPDPLWQVNIGHVHAREESATMQRELQALGYAAEITEETRANGEGFRVLLTGFGDRDAAELTAKDIMARTRFNGLWVSRSE
ncbi:MAG: SPOR domain-containing protein [Halioglobus sp.]|nr:SPOR domain-containing protein [Halioglobus sp.]